MDCVYCFEKDKEGGKLTSENLDYILNAIRIINSKGKCKIVLYGGEPLLLQNYGKIKTVLEFAASEKIRIKVITNGYCLERFSKLLLNYLEIIDSIMITLDGEKDQHDKSRRRKDGHGTYDKIVDNIGKIDQIGIPVEIRINIGVDNFSNVKYFIENNEICRLHKVQIHFIEDNRNLNNGIYTIKNRNDLLIDMYNFCNYYENISLEYPPLKQLDSMISEENFILPLFDYCDSDNTFLFDEKGNIYNCAEACGDERFLHKQGKHNCFLNIDIYKTCYLACICGGGCMWKRKQNGTQCKKEMKNLIESFIRNKLEEYEYEL